MIKWLMSLSGWEFFLVCFICILVGANIADAIFWVRTLFA